MKSGLKTFILLLLPLIWGCSEFIEPSLEDRTVNLLAPANQLETNIYRQTFWWDKVDNALGYRLQIISPDFTNAAQLILDTMVTTDKFVYTLDPGKYEWRVRPENGSSAGVYIKRSLTVYASSLTEQTVQLSSPASGIYITKAQLTYQWVSLFGATQYRLQVDKNNFLDENNLTLNATTDNLSFLQTLAAEGNYQFRIRAENATENSKWSTVRTFVYDITAPDKVTLSLPLDKQTVAKPVKLSWSKVTDAEKYEVMVYTSDAVTLVNSAYPLSTTSLETVFSSGDSGSTYYWRVRAVDAAGNKGELGDIRSFTIQ